MRSSCPGWSTRTRTSSSPRCVASSRNSTSARGSCDSRARGRRCFPNRCSLASARVGIAEGLLAGVTTFADTCASGVVLQALDEMGARGIMYLEVFSPDPEQCDAAVGTLRGRLEELRPRASARVRLGISPHAPYTVSDALFVATARLAREGAWPMAVHLAESEAEDRLVRDGPWRLRRRVARARDRRRTARRLPRRAPRTTRACSRRSPLLIHCVRASAPDLRSIARHDCAVAHCPGVECEARARDRPALGDARRGDSRGTRDRLHGEQQSHGPARRGAPRGADAAGDGAALRCSSPPRDWSTWRRGAGRPRWGSPTRWGRSSRGSRPTSPHSR